MIVLFAFMAAAFAILYAVSGKRYEELLEPLGKKEYQMKPLMPVALFILSVLKYGYISSYDRKLLQKLSELRGTRYCRYYLKIHWANKLSYFILGLLLLSFIGVGAGSDPAYWGFSAVVLGLLVYLPDRELDERLKKKRLQIQMEFPEFLNKLVLLINAGMTVGKAWEKILSDNLKQSPFYDELEQVQADIRAGKSEAQAYEDLARRIRLPEISKFVSMVIQNLRKGNSELALILRMQSEECWEMRKTVARRLGEEASTKMLLPMMIMFAAVLLIVATPAVLALKGL